MTLGRPGQIVVVLPEGTHFRLFPAAGSAPSDR